MEENTVLKYLESDVADHIFTSKEEMEEYNRFRRERDKWIILPLNQVGAYGISNLPLFVEERAEKPVVKINGFDQEVKQIDLTSQENKECIQCTGLFLCVPTEDGYVALPTDGRSLTSIYQRSDDFCGVMTRDNPKTGKMVLPIEEKAERVTRDNSLFSLFCKILFRDGKVRFSGSDQYTIADNGELIRILEEELQKQHPDMEYVEGAVSHEYLTAVYRLNNRMLEESLRISLNDMGNDIHELTSGVRFVTSDIGMSAVRANVYLDLDGTRVFLKGIAVNHKDSELEDTFAENLTKFGEVLKESEERIEQIGNVDVADVYGMVKMITEYYSTIFPSKVSEEVLNELPIRYPHGGTGIDVYLSLNDIINRHQKLNQLSLARTLDLQEQVAGLIYLPYDKLASGEVVLKK